MKILLDTCSLLWALLKPERLSSAAREALLDGGNMVAVSAVSFWEISLKYSLGKLHMSGALPADFPDFVSEMGWHTLPLTVATAACFDQLPRLPEHRDPFDRMLVWIAIREGFHFISRDAAMQAYRNHGLQLIE